MLRQRIDRRQDLRIFHGIQDAGVNIVGSFLIHFHRNVGGDTHALQADAIRCAVFAHGHSHRRPIGKLESILEMSDVQRVIHNAVLLHREKEDVTIGPVSSERHTN